MPLAFRILRKCSPKAFKYAGLRTPFFTRAMWHKYYIPPIAYILYFNFTRYSTATESKQSFIILNRTNMKRLLLSASTALLLFLFSCSKDTETPNPPISDSAEAKAAYDNNSFGIYKGVIIGSTGIIKLVINNGDNLIRAYIIIDGHTKDTLTSTASFTSGQAITNASFIGRISTMTFSVNSNGTNPNMVNITIQGHSNVTGLLVKETSMHIVRCYEGTYTGRTSGGNTSDGTFNCATIDTTIIGIARETATGYTDVVNGGGANGNVTAHGTVSTGATFSGTISPTQCNGTWVNGSYTGTWSGVRTL